GAQAPQQQVAVERAGDGAADVLQGADALGQAGVVGDHRPAHDVVVAVQVLGGALDHQVEAQFERALEVGRTEAVVAGGQDAAALADLGDGAQVEHPQARIGRALGPDQGGGGPDGGVQQVQVGQVDELGLEALAAEQLDVQAVGVTVDVVRQQDVPAGFEQLADRGHGGDPGAEGMGKCAALQVGQHRLKGGAGRVPAARVGE